MCGTLTHLGVGSDTRQLVGGVRSLHPLPLLANPWEARSNFQLHGGKIKMSNLVGTGGSYFFFSLFSPLSWALMFCCMFKEMLDRNNKLLKSVNSPSQLHLLLQTADFPLLSFKTLKSPRNCVRVKTYLDKRSPELFLGGNRQKVFQCFNRRIFNDSSHTGSQIEQSSTPGVGSGRFVCELRNTCREPKNTFWAPKIQNSSKCHL